MAVTLHSYTKTEYKNAPDHKTTPLNATNLNNSEDGIDNAYTDIAAVYSEQTTEDAKRALKSDLTSISQTGSTASQAISKNAIFYLNGTLVRAKTAIASGATFTLNTNYEVLGNGGLNALTRASFLQALRANVTYTNGLSEDLTSKLASGLESEYFPIQSWVNAAAISFISKSTNGWRVYLPQSTGYSGTLLTVITGIKIGV